MRTLIPWLAAAFVLIALWPAVCMGAEDEVISCQSAFLVPLPWRDSAWEMLAAVGAAVLTFLVLRRLLRRPGGTAS